MPQTVHDIFNVFNSQLKLSDFYPTTENPALAKVRIEKLDGREYLVVPMVMLTVGVHRGSNGSIYYSPQELAYSPKQWNMKPIVIEHPFNGGSGTDLEIYKKQAVGKVMNSFYADGKLKAEAWLDLEKVQEKCPEIIDHIKHGLPMEVSTGLTSDIFAESGVWYGEPYSGRIGNIRSDHLAILPKKQGACSLADGAGLLINSDHSEFPKVMHTYNAEYFPGSLATDEIQAPERKKQPVAQEPPMDGTDATIPNPFGIERIVSAQHPDPLTGNFPNNQNTPVEPMIPLSAVQSMIRESLAAVTEGIKAAKPEVGVSADTPPVISPTVELSTSPVEVAPVADPIATTPVADPLAVMPITDPLAVTPVAEVPGQPPAEPPEEPSAEQPVPAPQEESLASGTLSEEDLQAIMPEIATLIESLYHLLTKAKNPPLPETREVQIENPLITNAATDSLINEGKMMIYKIDHTLTSVINKLAAI